MIRRLTKHVYVQSIIFLSSGVQPFNVQITAVFEYLMPPLFFALTNLPPKTVSLISVPFVDGSSCWTRNRGKAQRVARPVQMRLCISYLPTDWLCYCRLANDFWNRHTVYFGHVCTHPPIQMSNKISGVTGLTFTKFLPDVEESSSVLKQQSALRCSRPLLNASSQNEDGLCQFSPTRHKSWKFGDDQYKHGGGNIENEPGSTRATLTRT